MTNVLLQHRTHWTAGLLSREYIPGEYECVDMVREAVKMTRGITIAPRDLPSERNFRRWTSESAEGFFGHLVRQLDSPDEAEDGDLVLMKIKGRKRDIGSHVGVFVNAPNGKRCVVHCVVGSGVRLQSLDSLGYLSVYEMVGIYKWL